MSGAVHTPGTALPWHLGNGDIYAEGTKSSDFDDIVICAIGQAGGFRSHEYALARAHKPDGKANAAYIVHACNTLPALQAHADAMAEALDQLWTRAVIGTDAERYAALDAARATLAAYQATKP